MRAAILLALGALLMAAKCVGPEPIPAPPDLECQPPEAHFTFLDTDTRVYRQGATIRLTPTVDVAPAGTREIPLRCTSNWTVAGAATLSRDRRTLTIAPDAPVGSIVAVRFLHGTPVEGRFRIVGANEVVLTGRRMQRGIEGCTVADEVRELEFGSENRFSVTFMPFETYKDYWGSYVFDAATGRLAMTVERGNFVPPGLDLEGQAELSGGQLVLRDMFLGSRQSPPPPQSCTYRF